MITKYTDRDVSTINITSDWTLSESEILSNKWISNQNASGEVDVTFPALDYYVSCVVILSEAQNMELGPPSGETFDLDGTTLDADDCVDSDSTVGSKIAITRMKNAAGVWIWSLDTIRGVWTDTGASD